MHAIKRIMDDVPCTLPTVLSQCRELMPTGDLPRAVHEGYHSSRGDIL